MTMKAALVVVLVVASCVSVEGFVSPLGEASVVASSFQGRRAAVSAHQRPFRTGGTSPLFAALTDQEDYDETCDVLVLGSGPAARSIAALLSSPKNGLDVIMSDKNLDREWPPNYGVWTDEWQAVLDKYQAAGVTVGGGACGDAIDRDWKVTDCFFGGSFDLPMDNRMTLDRPYRRVDKKALQETLSPSTYRQMRANHISKAIGVNLYEPAGSLVHDADGTTMQLETADDETVTVRSKLVVDCTGHETKLVLRDARDPYGPPGFQIAYGVSVEVDESDSPDLSKIGPYDKEAMTLFDYRTDHYESSDPAQISKVASAPTFMYAMPLSGNRIFFEETSLVARPAVSFQDCKDRCFERLKFHGIKVTKIEEEEYCYIPMGGALPAKDQRVLALGGAAAMVHPSTGYHLCRCMLGAADLAATVVKELAQDKPNLDRAAASGYHSLWTPENIRQRNFAVFGGEFFMKQDVVGLRGFFDGFFRLPLELWGGFLAGWPGLPNNESHGSWFARIWFGVNFIVRIPPPVAIKMAASIVGYIISEPVPLAQSVTPFLGEPDSYEYKPNMDGVGDVAAKSEARRMIQASKLGQDLPVDFNSSSDKGENDSVKIPSKAPVVAVSEPAVAAATVVVADVDEEPTTEEDGGFQ